MASRIGKYLKLILSGITELIWPTRCVVCDAPNYLLCPECAKKLDIIDQLKTCHICGEPYGKIQCCSCTDIDNKKNIEHHYKKAVSFCVLDKISGRIITQYKDAGEIRVSKILAYYMNKCIPTSWIQNKNFYLTYIPSSKEAVLKRGFDHCRQTCFELSKISNVKMLTLLSAPESKDQRQLNRNQRISNLENKFHISVSYKNNKINQTRQFFTSNFR